MRGRDGRLRPAAISLGPNPTFGEGAGKLEVHLPDYAGELYGRDIEVDFLARLRDIIRFDSVGRLVDQMDRDVAAARPNYVALDLAYASTIHKAQGREFPDVAFVDDLKGEFNPGDRATLVYTACTRSSRSLLVSALG